MLARVNFQDLEGSLQDLSSPMILNDSAKVERDIHSFFYNKPYGSGPAISF